MASKKYSSYTATMVVVANMIGTGVFTSLGFQVMGIHSIWSILLLWTLGGVIAFTGALCYAELSTLHTRSGGEYHLLSFLYNKPVGFMAGWISLTVGFAAPVAAAAMALGNYFTAATNLKEWSFLGIISGPQLVALTVVFIVTMLNLFQRNIGATFQNIFTTIKILFIIFFIGIGLMAADYSLPQFQANDMFTQDIFSKGFAVSIYFVLYAYSGWNAVAYFAGEVKNPQKNIARSILSGTIIVTLLYLLLNFAFMAVLPFSEVEGQLEVGYIFTQKIYGNTWGAIMGFIISFLLISSVSSMVIAGPRVSKVMGEDFKSLSFLKRTNKQGIPQVPILLQSGLTVIYILTSSFQQMITLIGFVLNMFTFLAVLGLVIYRIRHPERRGFFRVKLLGLVAGIFILVNLWVLYYGFTYKTYESLIGIGFSLLGLLVYLLVRKSRVTASEEA